MAEIKNRLNNYFFLIPKKKDYPLFIRKFLEYSYVHDFTVSYSEALIHTFPEYFTIEKLYSPNENPLETLIEVIEKFYLDKNHFAKLSELTNKNLNKKFSKFSDDFKYKNSILFSISFKVKPLFEFHPKERDLVLKKQEFFGISSDIESEKEEGTADISTNLYSGWIDFRAQDLFNELAKSKTVNKLPKTAAIQEVAVNSEFIAIFEHIFAKFQADAGFIHLELEPF